MGAAPLERDVEAYLVRRCEALGWEVRKIKWIGRIAAPDRLILARRRDRQDHLEGLILFVELKKPGEKPRIAQEREHNRLRAAGATVYVVDSMNAVDSLIWDILHP